MYVLVVGMLKESEAVVVNAIDTQMRDQTDKHGTDPMSVDGMYVCIVIHIARVWINRVRLPILLVVS